MLILAIDTALEACAAAVLDTDAGELLAQEQVLMKRGHAEALMPMIARVMQSADLAFTSLDRIAVTVGRSDPCRGKRRSESDGEFPCRDRIHQGGGNKL